ncbi:hypothetical protein TIFTF001_018426 [Ficus carica]|uniref:Uncharacterized protein n=1 Tax=Ficus carica TaxID=3494 RepID=A0AA88ACG2_FICCA|nr:hypothetical protein TIFTF001_018426 [Ficus carica]
MCNSSVSDNKDSYKRRHGLILLPCPWGLRPDSSTIPSMASWFECLWQVQPTESSNLLLYASIGLDAVWRTRNDFCLMESSRILSKRRKPAIDLSFVTFKEALSAPPPAPLGARTLAFWVVSVKVNSSLPLLGDALAAVLAIKTAVSFNSGYVSFGRALFFPCCCYSIEPL